MTIDKAIKTVERWQAGGFATQIDDMNPALNLLIEAGKVISRDRNLGMPWAINQLPGETKD